MSPARLSTFFPDADIAGVSWEKVAATELQHGVEELRGRFRSLELDYAQRAMLAADVAAPPPVAVGGFLGYITGTASDNYLGGSSRR